MEKKHRVLKIDYFMC